MNTHSEATNVFFVASKRKTQLPRPRTRLSFHDAQPNDQSSAPKTGIVTATHQKNARVDRERFYNKPSTIPRKVASTNSNSTKSGKMTDSKTSEPCKASVKQNNNYASDNEGNGDESVSRLKMDYESNVNDFETLRNEVINKQKMLKDICLKMQSTRKKIEDLGHAVPVPKGEDCTGGMLNPEDIKTLKTVLSVDVKKLSKLPDGLMMNCEKALVKRKEIIDWLDALVKSGIKGIQANQLVKRIKDYSAENEMLSRNLDEVKTDFMQNLNEVVACLRKSMNDMAALHCRNVELVHDIAERESKIVGLRKQVQAYENLKSNATRLRVEKLEKMLEDEKTKKMVIKNRLNHAEVQLKNNLSKVQELEDELEMCKSLAWEHERTISELREQNEKIKAQFEQELLELTNSIKENTSHLEQIEADREKLQAEKEDLEHRLQELSETYGQSLQNMKNEIKHKIAQVIEAEQKIYSTMEEKSELESQVEVLIKQQTETETNLKEKSDKLEQKELELEKTYKIMKQQEVVYHENNHLKDDIRDYQERFSEQRRLIEDIESKLSDFASLENNLKLELQLKEGYIADLEKKCSCLEQQQLDCQFKMDTYEEQLTSLRSSIKQLQEDFGEFENLNELREMVNDTRRKISETNLLNEELSEALHSKNLEIEQHVKNLDEQMQIIRQKEDKVKELTEKEEEQAHVIAMLHKKLEDEINSKREETSAEVQALLTSLEARKRQVSELEKIIITLEEKLHKVNGMKRHDHEIIIELQEKLAHFEAKYKEGQNNEGPEENLDTLIKILEDELDSPFDTKEIPVMEHGRTKNNYSGDCKKPHQMEKFVLHRNHTSVRKDTETTPTKIVLGNFVKKTYNITSHSKDEMNVEKLHRKKAITNIDSSKWSSAFDSEYDLHQQNMEKRSNSSKLRNLPASFVNQFTDEKKYKKMLKIAGHRL